MIEAIAPPVAPLADQVGVICFEFTSDVSGHAPAQQEIIPPRDVPDDGVAVTHRAKTCAFRFEFEAEMLAQVFGDPFLPLVHLLSLRCEQCNVVAIAPVSGDT